MEEALKNTTQTVIDTERKCSMDQQILNTLNYNEGENKTKLMCLKREAEDISLAPNTLQDTVSQELSAIHYSDLTNKNSCAIQKTDELSNKMSLVANLDEYNMIQTDAHLCYNNSAEYIFESLQGEKPVVSKDFKDKTSYIKCEIRDPNEQGPTTNEINDSSNTDREDCVGDSRSVVIPDTSSLSTVTTSFINKSSWTPRKELRVFLRRIDVTDEHIRELSKHTDSCNRKSANQSITRINRSRNRRDQKTVGDLSVINSSVRVTLEDCLKSRLLRHKLDRAVNIQKAECGPGSAHSIGGKAVSNSSATENEIESLQSKEGNRVNLDPSNRKKRELSKNRIPNQKNSNIHRETNSPTSNADSVGYTDKQEEIEEYSHNQRKKVNIRKEHFFTCNICFQSFFDNRDYIVHLKIHNGYKFICWKCCITFKYYEELLKHKRIKHRRFQCKDCGSLFQSLIALETHNRIHRKQTHFTCDTCSEYFRNKNDLMTHRRSHSEYKYKCVECPEAFKEEQFLTLHKCVQKVSCVCTVCKKFFENRFQLDQHKKQHSKKRLFRCRLCKVKFTTKGNLKTHMKLHTEERFNCAYCMRPFTTKEFLERHISSVHFKEDIVCNVCNHSFMNRNACNKHMIIHSEKTYKCSNCAKLFKTEESLTFHSRVHNNEIICELCEKPFASKSELEIHERTHTGFKPFCCLKCGKLFTQNSNLKTHMKGVHSKMKPFQCKFCTSHFKLKENMKNHIKNVHFKKHVKCEHCDKLLASKGSLVTHMNRMHTVKYSKCKDCGMVVKEANLRLHKSSHHPTNGKRKVSCIHCSKNFTCKRNLLLHMKTHAAVKDYTCKECGAQFSQRSHLRTHSFVHSKERHLNCDDCGKGFSLKTTLTLHCMQHLNERAYKCKFCAKSYNIKSCLKMHVKSNHTNKESWEFSCNECGKQFCSKSRLKNHIWSHKDMRPFKCSTCGSSYKYKGGLREHMASHSAVRAFKCNICEKSYKSKLHLKHHIGTHSTLRAFQCSLCPRTFKRKGAAKTHMFTHRTESDFECDRCGKRFKAPSYLQVHRKGHKTWT